MPGLSLPDSVSLFYRDEGFGRPVLCLPGLTRDSRDFDFVAPHLTGIRLIRLDYRGRGQSGWADWRSYTVAQEAADVLALMDHLGLARAAILGTSRGGLIAMLLAATARDRLLGVALNDIGPEIAAAGLDRIRDYIGRPSGLPDLDALAAALPGLSPGFANVPPARWRAHADRIARPLPGGGLGLTYDPDLRRAVLDGGATPVPDLWPLFDALAGLPLALIRGANSDLLTADTAAEMARRRPDMILATVPDRAHVPWLDEPASLAALHAWLDRIP
ncbi:MAG: alpha/beta hydrolase [Rhodobacteraceae bacterium]|jgi:pimeloyl-ACP methyl ester carboxylesterase|nr:alpha/beta hydrolase [Paracoccaceae bacterium]